MEGEQGGKAHQPYLCDEGLPDDGEGGCPILLHVQGAADQEEEDLLQDGRTGDRQEGRGVHGQAEGVRAGERVEDLREGPRGVRPGGGLECDDDDENDEGALAALQELFFDYLPTVPSDAYVCVNNLVHLFGSTRAIKRALTNLSVACCVSRQPHDVTGEPFLTGQPILVRLKGLCEIPAAYAWPGGVMDPLPTKQHLVLVRPTELQRLALMNKSVLASKIVKMTNEVVNYKLEDVLGLACDISGVNDSCV
ncbi:hypothetical protein CAPTEDRAFT_200295 [Capitella teleta]|uniref:Uncharacterized protein n=1 Tax=Capitella teleta TaxID=283909 RepID=R7UEL4_CAPTE|nr:hypothetical protein CAPTEDRAFT_200295 [Capitella teleta]|eukprot:ELU04974.1 hypothetical protein CAPTEDRAFT_200295 [Capitella teleta]